MTFEPPDDFNIADLLGARLRDGDADRVALRLDEGEVTYATVAHAAARYAAALTEDLGVRPEERVLLVLPDGADFVAALFGTLAVGAVVVMLNPGLTSDALAGILGYARARAAVVHRDHLDQVRAAARVADVDLAYLPVGGNGGALRPAASSPAGFAAVRTHPDDPAIWLFSGGTTGLPKAVVQTHRSFGNTTACYGHGVIGYTPDDITIAVPKLYFGYATGSNLLFPFSVGASAALFAERPTPEVLFDRIARFRPTILVTVPSMISAMLEHPAAGDADLSSLRLATSAGEALPPPLYDRWVTRFGVELLDGLGTAEQWHVFVSNRPGDVRPGTLGRAVPGFRVEARDADGRALPAGEVGALWVSGDSRAIGYWRNMARTKEVFRGEWVVTGDLVRIDADGYVTYAGRGDDALKVKGKWLLPAEVEACLIAHPDVAEAVVVGTPDADGLVKPVAFVTATAPREHLAAELREHVLANLEPYKHPRVIEVIESLPRTHLGKADRGALKRRAADRLAAEAGT